MEGGVFSGVKTSKFHTLPCLYEFAKFIKHSATSRLEITQFTFQLR